MVSVDLTAEWLRDVLVQLQQGVGEPFLHSASDEALLPLFGCQRDVTHRLAQRGR